MKKDRCIAIVLAAGKGKRMGSEIQKQYLLLNGKPMIWYSLDTFQKCELIDEIILVTGAGEEEYCRREIVEKYRFSKVVSVIPGGRERYHSVANGLHAISECDYVFIHDGARPFLTGDIIDRVYAAVKKYQACVVGMPVKDTIKVVDSQSFAVDTPDRSALWLIQTPQVFSYELIRKAYDLLLEQGDEAAVTDDAMVAELLLGTRVKLVEGSYRNIKVTTPEDLKIAEAFCPQV
ncbi:2-C-methyl-D-erythritol 4-phosphate cytidylyltransferase [Diplocloster hominis]|uniref:2-C-methyl-D-erythritol 4-phosphate cytidylyltransferase n=1 Tax=Diplocloster hominis TaxID=3079010 RepID=UPI0031BA879F